ncbi:MAG TPA: hypothetical protein DEP78_04295, partial [Verrucomicrobiales bacterium]|nr:hypothetical protein [Verrucomicrobiales bacterium]
FLGAAFLATFFLGAAFFTAFLAGFLAAFFLAFMFCFLGVFCLLGGAVFWWMESRTSLNLSSTFSFA